MIGDRWGVTDDEVSRSYPCDDFIADVGFRAWRGVTVNATPRAIWPWLIQVRLAPYSYDWIDNLGRRSPQELRHLDDPLPGEPFTASAGRPLGQVLAVEHGVHLTARILGIAMTYQLIPAESGYATRLLLKLVGAKRYLAPLLSVGDLVMARRQLLNFKHLAESPGTA